MSESRRSRALPWIAAAAGCALVAGVLLAADLGSAPAPEFGAGLSPADTSMIQLQQTTRAAPPFRLTDQHGHRIELHSFTGRPVVLTFNDDKCEDLCTLLAQDVIAADRDLGPDRTKIAFVSVNANPFHTSVADVDDWTRQHGLAHLPNWYYGTASAATLAATAKRYRCDINADPSTGEVLHCTTIYFIDPDGTEQAIGGFGSDSADTAPFAHAMTRMAADLAHQSMHVAGASLPTPTGSGTSIGDTAPPLTLPALSGTDPPVSDGRYRIVDFWSSTCTACREELPALQKEATRLTGKVDVVGVDVDDTATTGRAFAAREGVAFPSLSDSLGTTAATWRVPALPYLVIADPHGRILIRHPGTMTIEQLDYVIRDLDAALPPSG
jgi:cytochrome oxidase Cu insertion factor (SCO1/SenC/PrrC family)